MRVWRTLCSVYPEVVLKSAGIGAKSAYILCVSAGSPKAALRLDPGNNNLKKNYNCNCNQFIDRHLEKISPNYFFAGSLTILMFQGPKGVFPIPHLTFSPNRDPW